MAAVELSVAKVRPYGADVIAEPSLQRGLLLGIPKEPIGCF